LESPLKRSRQRLHSSASVGAGFAPEAGAAANRFALFAEEEAADALEAEPEPESGGAEALRLGDIYRLQIKTRQR
jgi:hypothetical protein